MKAIKKGGCLMGIFNRKEKTEEFADSVYQRRLARSEVPATPKSNYGYANIKELKMQIKELTAENSRLHSKIEKMQEYMNGLYLSMSIEETIQAMKDKPASVPANPFAAFFKTANGGTTDSSSTTDGKVINDNIVEALNQYLEDSIETVEDGEFDDGEIEPDDTDAR